MTDFKDRISGLSPKRLALLAVELQKKLERAESRSVEPIAVVGIGCRFPGEAHGPDEYWRMLSEGVDCISEVPPDRWDIDELYDPDPKATGKMITRNGGFINDVDKFDAAFFGITPREATSLDPRYRILLENVWEALEHAGQAPDRLLGSPTGVFVGACGSDYYQLLVEGRPDTLDAYLVSGVATSMAAGRISYALGLQGPALTVDTACSSSLVAVHLACQSLRAGECEMALACGTTLILAPEVSIGLSTAEMLSPDGRCRTFDADADGIVRGEGCGTVVLKRLSDAEAAGDRVLALIQGTAINQDGRSGGITAPNGPSQEAVIGEALRRSGIEAAEVSYVETHGTGTTLGDPIEVRALDAALGKGRKADKLLKIGSVKTNFGHLEASAGIAGLIKVVLALDHEKIPPHLHLQKRSPHIEWQDMCLTIPTEVTPWPREMGRRISGISSFGFSGTNAHVIVEEAPAPEASEVASERDAQILVLSAKTAPALDELVNRYDENLALHPERNIEDVCFTANARRARFGERIAVVGSSQAEIREGLQALRQGSGAGNAWRGRVTSSKTPEVLFLFPGQGCPDVEIARTLLENEPVVAKVVEQCSELLLPVLGDAILPALREGELPTDEPRIAPAAAFVWQFAMAELWRSWGVVPAVGVGYGAGEYVAACVAGVFSLEDALKLTVLRAELSTKQPAGQSMLAVYLDPIEVAEQVTGQLKIAAINGPSHTVVSGPADELDSLRQEFESSGVAVQSLAARSAVLDGTLPDELERAVAGMKRARPRFGLISSVTGQLIKPDEAQAPAYWRRQCSEAVDFLATMTNVAADGHRIFLDSGTNSALLALGRQIVREEDAAWLPSLVKGQDAETQMLRSLAGLFVRGVNVDWEAFYKHRSRQIVSLPTYPFEGRRYWVKTAPGTVAAGKRESWRDWLYEFQWQTLGKRAADARDLRSPDEVADLASQHIESLAEWSGIDVYREFAPKIDALCSAYVVQALGELGWSADESGAPINADELQQRLGILPEHHRLLHRMLEMLEEDDVLESHPQGGWRCVALPPPLDTEAFAAELQEGFPECAAELDLTLNCARSLAAVLSGKTDPMQLLFPDGSLAMTERLYQESIGLRCFNSLTRETIAAACSGLGTDRKLRILELGAGTGAATSYILPALDADVVEYVFTDVSNAFLSSAADKFSKYPFVEYRLLDAGSSPLDQGFSAGEFDIVIAANVIHATPDLRRTLANIRETLAPSGLVVLLEGTVPQRFGDLTVGLTPGWWSFTDVDLRPSYALLSATQWQDLFIECGFESVAAVPDGTHPLGGAINQQSVLVARAPAVAASEGTGRSGGDWVVFCDAGGTGDALVAAAVADGGRCITVRKGDTFHEDGDAYTIDASAPADFSRLFDTLLKQRQLSLRGAVHCWGLDETIPDDASLRDLQAAELRACGSALYLAQALAECARDSIPRLALLTRGSQAVTDGETCNGFSQASIWGLARVIELEHAELNCVVVDLADEPAATAARELLDRVISAEIHENQLAFRDGQMLALRAVPSAGAEEVWATEVKVSAAGNYIVTGGLGGLGLLVAGWLVERGARHLTLVGRNAPNADAAASVEAMKAAGAAVDVVLGDIATTDCVDKLEQAIAASGKPLQGIIHCAGAIDDGALLQQDWGRFQRVMAAKVLGTWNLHRLGDGKPLDFFVLFSTGASFLGSPGQSNHAAANAFMDAVAHYRHARGLPALTINWGPWSGTGAAVRTGVADFAVASGMGNISPKQGLAILEHLMESKSATQVAVLPAKPARLVETHQTARPMPVFEELVKLAARDSSAEAVVAVQESVESELLAALAQASPKARHTVLLREVQQAAQSVMGLGNADPVDPRRPLIDLGLDSLMAVELRNAIGKLVNHTLPATLLFNYPSIDELVDHLLEDVLKLGAADSGSGRPNAEVSEDEARGEELGELGEDELADLLESKLADMDHES